MQVVLCFFVYTGLDLPMGNFISDFAGWRVEAMTAVNALASTEGVLWKSMLASADNPVIKCHLALNSDFLVYLSLWFIQARRGDFVRCFSPGFNLHMRLARFLDRQSFLSSLVDAMLRKKRDMFPNPPQEQQANEDGGVPLKSNYRTSHTS